MLVIFLIIAYAAAAERNKKWGLKIILDIPFLVHVVCTVHILCCTNTLRVPFIIEHLVIASEECFVCWLVLPFRERNNFIQLPKSILYCIY